MPTRIFVDSRNSIEESGASTAQTADMNWVSTEFVASKIRENSGLLERKAEYSLNDTTLSGSMLLEALQEFESIRSKRNGDEASQTGKHPTSTPQSLEDSDTMRRTEKETSTSSLQSSQHCEEIATPERPNIRKQPRSRVRQPGPNERNYMRTHHDFVKKVISKYDHNGRLPNYREMDEASKDTERIFVLGLLKRLQIQDVPSSNVPHDVSEASIYQSPLKNSLQSLDETLASMKSSEKSLTIYMENSPVPESSTIPSTRSPCLLKTTPHSQRQSVSYQSKESNATSPIEIGRSKVAYESPLLLCQRHKRTATTSGKRGADLARTRREPPSEIFSELNLYEQPSEIAESSFHDLSLSGGNIHLESETPASPGVSHILNLSCDSSPGTHGIVSDDKMLDDSLSVSSSQRASSMFCQKNRILREVPLNPCLKHGKNADYKPLQVKFERKAKERILTQSIPDRFDGYRDRTKQKLVRLVKWIRNQGTRSKGKGIILSLSDQQVVDVVLNFLNEYSHTEEQRSRGKKVGGTLIVLRSKEDAETWCRALREGCTQSVLNHPEMHRMERVSPNSAIPKLASHSIVITTFDALKAPDATIACDGKGVAITSSSSSQSDWQKSRSSQEVRQCKEMSLIHHLQWQRVFFVDILGKKSFLVKGGTARVTSARALNSDTR